MSEREPNEYKFKHPRQISLDGYHGVGNGMMELNDPIADGFMRTSDMRSDIFIIQKPHDRVQDYDQIGNVRVAKLLQLPRLELWRKDKVLYTRREGDIYYLAVDDQELSHEIANSNDGTKRFDDLYVERFRQEVIRGLSSILRKEKLLNGGHYNLTFLWSYYQFIFVDAIVVPSALVAQYATGISGPETLGQTAIATGLLHGLGNGANLAIMALNFVLSKIHPSHANHNFVGSTWDEPFIKHSIPDIALPPVPVDRILRGEFYLDRRGKNLIKDRTSD